MKRSLLLAEERWPFATPFVTSHATYSDTEVLVVSISQGQYVGLGEGSPVEYKGESLASMAAAIEAVRPALEAGADRAALGSILPPGGARNAVDCALWALEARAMGTRPQFLAGLANAGFQTVTTISLDTPEAMAQRALQHSEFRGLKLKLSADDPISRVRAVRHARPDAQLLCDVNGAWSLNQLRLFAPALAECGVELIEQPLAVGEDAQLIRGDSSIPLCADESCCSFDDLDGLSAGYSAVCVKLDKTGGLTEALELTRAARARGLAVLVSNMAGTSLAMAPASLLASLSQWVDLDGPLLLSRDRENAIFFSGDRAAPFPPEIWA